MSLEHKHLILKGKSKVLTVEQVKSWIENLVTELDMELVKNMPANPSVGYEGSKDCGVSGVAIITTSHIVMHTWDKTLEFQLDVYSCKNFEPITVKNQLDKIGFEITDVKFFDREYNIIELDTKIN